MVLEKIFKDGTRLGRMCALDPEYVKFPWNPICGFGEVASVKSLRDDGQTTDMDYDHGVITRIAAPLSLRLELTKHNKTKKLIINKNKHQ